MKKTLVGDAEHCEKTHNRWMRHVDRDMNRSDAPDEWYSTQCFKCIYYIPLVGALIEDWGVCSNAESPRDGKATFEHDGCAKWEEAEEMWQTQARRRGQE